MFQMPETLPAPSSTKTKNGKGWYGQTEREVKTRWVLNPEEAAAGADAVVVDLTTYHYGERKQYSSMLTWGTVEAPKEGSVFHVETWASDHTSWRPLTKACARHSLKAMESHHAEALLMCETLFASHAANVFFDAAMRGGLMVTEEV